MEDPTTVAVAAVAVAVAVRRGRLGRLLDDDPPAQLFQVLFLCGFCRVLVVG